MSSTGLTLNSASSTHPSNPIDHAEEVLILRDAAFDRLHDDELVGELSAPWGNLRLWASWEPLCDVFMLTCAYGTKVPDDRRARLVQLLATLNERMVMGHFEMSSDDGTLFYRYGQLVKASAPLDVSIMDELLDIAACECERFYPVFQTALWAGSTNEDALNLALLQPVGTA